MSGAWFLPANLHARASSKVRRLAAWLAASASDPEAGLALVIGFAAAHAVLWTLILINLKAAQDVHMDVAEAFAWGQKFQLGYGKHPPLSGWVAGGWFRMFPVTDWSTYALAMATVGVLFALYLVSAELLIIGNICLWCTSVHVVTFLLFVLIIATVPPMLGWGTRAVNDEDYYDDEGYEDERDGGGD